MYVLNLEDFDEYLFEEHDPLGIKGELVLLIKLGDVEILVLVIFSFLQLNIDVDLLQLFISYNWLVQQEEIAHKLFPLHETLLSHQFTNHFLYFQACSFM